MECEILQSPMISYRSLLFIATIMSDYTSNDSPCYISTSANHFLPTSSYRVTYKYNGRNRPITVNRIYVCITLFQFGLPNMVILTSVERMRLFTAMF